jgi:ADP-ribose pyrophosphatase YjhB (NUDIX family)
MSNDEKIEILKFDFESLYYKLYLQKPPKIYPINMYEHSYVEGYFEIKNYLRKKNYYDKLTEDKDIKSLIKNSASSGIIYEIPKGRQNKHELPLDCAIREFSEETKIKKESYHFVTDETIKYTFISNNIKYVINYYVAITNNQNEIKLHFNSEQIAEIDEIKWVGIEEIKFIESYNCNNKKISEVFKSAKHFVKTKLFKRQTYVSN